jgi:hypothetical protein
MFNGEDCGRDSMGSCMFRELKVSFLYIVIEDN